MPQYLVSSYNISLANCISSAFAPLGTVCVDLVLTVMFSLAVEEAIRPQHRDNLVRFSCRAYQSIFLLILCVAPKVLRATDGLAYRPTEKGESIMVEGSSGGLCEIINGQVSCKRTVISELGALRMPGLRYSRMLLSSLPGSAPARCSSKCDGCNPCEAVQVRVQPPQDTDGGYYPEAWRCKCGGRLYMP